MFHFTSDLIKLIWTRIWHRYLLIIKYNIHKDVEILS